MKLSQKTIRRLGRLRVERFTVETERADHVIKNQAGFNAFASWKELHSSEPPEVFVVVANVEDEDGMCTSHYTVAQFFSSEIPGEFSTDGKADANAYAAILNREANTAD